MLVLWCPNVICPHICRWLSILLLLRTIDTKIFINIGEMGEPDKQYNKAIYLSSNTLENHQVKLLLANRTNPRSAVDLLRRPRVIPHNLLPILNIQSRISNCHIPRKRLDMNIIPSASHPSS